jgi:hypothetical protein
MAEAALIQTHPCKIGLSKESITPLVYYILYLLEQQSRIGKLAVDVCRHYNT